MEQLGIVTTDAMQTGDIVYLTKTATGMHIFTAVKATDLITIKVTAVLLTKAEAEDLYPDCVWYSLEELGDG